ncbi:hypothetical protein HAP48_0042770 [Bradyrhizobium septentrionale]|uniref:Uncharacterized protein n=1 Tax=Bradyrhizobium septentrionale TaxID=1404411 RepID=A0A973W2L1_9BRAD|nr:hypothetical protein [Bradyrhizobium septentrionale]UGY15182.1 hypothetical protein HAP48_0042770 [Bradyrhizobium septentrionale]
MAGTNTHYTIREAKAILAQHGMTISSDEGEYRVAFKIEHHSASASHASGYWTVGRKTFTGAGAAMDARNAAEGSSYYTTQLVDAIGTGIEMARHEAGRAA